VLVLHQMRLSSPSSLELPSPLCPPLLPQQVGEHAVGCSQETADASFAQGKMWDCLIP
jgi:hypothetical protein